MPRFNIYLEEQLSDSRSSEAAFRVKIENLGGTPLELRRISPRIPEGVVLLEVKDSSSEAARSKHKRLCEELTELLNEHIFEACTPAREARLQIEKSFVDDMLKDLSSMWRPYYQFFSGQQAKILQRKRERLQAQKFVITGKCDADIALKQWFSDPTKTSLFRQMFQSKYDQLFAVEALLSNAPEAAALASIEPDSFFATTYVLRFPRTALNPAKFSFSVEVALADPESTREVLGSTTTTVEISAQPYVLSTLSVVCSLLGVAVKFSIDKASDLPVDEFFHMLGRLLATGQGISAIVLAVVVFNIYEQVEFGQKLNMRVGWRSAMVVGVLSGLFSERMIAALKALVGA